MSDPEPIKSAMRGWTVDPKDLDSATNWVTKLGEQWDKDIGGYIDNTIKPLLDKAGERQASVVTDNPHGHFDEATNLHDDVSHAHRALRARATAIGGLLRQLAQGTDTIAQQYTRVDKLNAANQDTLTSQLDSSMNPTSAADPTGAV